MRMLFSLCLPRDEYSVPVVRHLTRDALLALGVTDDCVADIEVAVTEASTNVFKHASAQGQYEVRVDIDEYICEIRVMDAGTGFDEEALAGSTALEPDAEQGRGLHLIRSVVDKLKLESAPESGTIVYIIKRLTTTEDSVLRRLAGSAAAAD